MNKQTGRRRAMRAADQDDIQEISRLRKEGSENVHYIKYKENKTHGTAGFPVGYYHVNKMHPQYAMPCHWHEELEWIHIITGTFTVTINEITRTAAPGDILIVNSGFLHGGTPCDCIYECLVAPLNLLASTAYPSAFLQQLSQQKILLRDYYPAGSAAKLYALTEALFKVMQDKGTGRELAATGLLYQILGTICSEHLYTESGPSVPSAHKNIYQLKNVLNYIEDHYSGKIGLETLARIAGMSPKYFCRFFYEMTQHTPIDYVNYYRIERACYQLVNTVDSVTNVALSCGFNDTSYFIKTFKKYKGKSPGQYLKDPIRNAVPAES